MFVVFAANAVVVAVVAAAVAHTLGPVRNPPLQKNAFSHEGGQHCNHGNGCEGDEASILD